MLVHVSAGGPGPSCGTMDPYGFFAASLCLLNYLLGTKEVLLIDPKFPRALPVLSGTNCS